MTQPETAATPHDAAPPTAHLLDDEAMAAFVINGFHFCRPALPDGLNQRIYDALESMPANPGDGIWDALPDLRLVYQSPEVVGALTSILGAGYAMFPHRHVHKNLPGSRSQQLHQDNLHDARFAEGHVRHPDDVRSVLAMYYPQDVSTDMGPTALLPGTHHFRAPADRMAGQGNFREQVLATVEAGTVLIVHYDLWHAGTRNRSDRVRYMVKFLFDRTHDNAAPSWNHDPTRAADLQRQLEDARPMALQQQLADKQRHLRLRMWNALAGAAAIDTPYRDKWAGDWPRPRH